MLACVIRPTAGVLVVLVTAGSACLLANPRYGPEIDDEGPSTGSGANGSSSSATGGMGTQGPPDTGEDAVGDDDGPTDTSVEDDTTSGQTSGVVGGESGTEPETDCDPYAPRCAPGRRCNPFASTPGPYDGAACFIEEINPQQLGEPCLAKDYPRSGLDNCAAGLTCIIDNEVTASGRCARMCEGSNGSSCDPNGEICATEISEFFGLCGQPCNPLEPECPQDQACYLAPSSVCLPVTSDSAFVEPCDLPMDCLPGMTCVSNESLPDCAASSCCTNFCGLSPGVCPVGYECTAANVQNPDVGVCTQ